MVRASNHMPCAIGRPNPNGRAVSRYRWIGLRSPEIAAYRRPMSDGTSQPMVAGTGVGLGRGSARPPLRCR